MKFTLPSGPEAFVVVRHNTDLIQKRCPCCKELHDFAIKSTFVSIKLPKQDLPLVGTAVCSPLDNYNKTTGRKTALIHLFKSDTTGILPPGDRLFLMKKLCKKLVKSGGGSTPHTPICDK